MSKECKYLSRGILKYSDMDPVYVKESNSIGQKDFWKKEKANQYLTEGLQCANVVTGASWITPLFLMGDKQADRL